MDKEREVQQALPATRKINNALGWKIACGILATLVVALLVVLALSQHWFGLGGESESEQTQCIAEESKVESGGSDKPSKSGDSNLSKLAKSQRDTQRKNDILRFLTAVADYQTNNSGKLPFTDDGTMQKFITRYLDDKYDGKKCSDRFQDPDGTCYQVVTNDIRHLDVYSGGIGGEEFPNDHKIIVYVGAKCGDDDASFEQAGERQIAVFYKLEEDNKVFCKDNY